MFFGYKYCGREVFAGLVGFFLSVGCGAGGGGGGGNVVTPAEKSLSLSPAPGEYDYSPVVKFTYPEDGLVRVKLPDGSWKAATASACSAGVSPGTRGVGCFNTVAAHVFEYKLSIPGKSDVVNRAEYQINQGSQKSIVINQSTRGVLLTECYVEEKGFGEIALHANIRLDDSEQNADKNFDFSLIMSKPNSPQPTRINGLSLRQIDSTCTAMVKEAELGGRATGTLGCTRKSESKPEDDDALETIEIPSFSWKCDRWTDMPS